MGLEYRYLLYFKREDLWDALQSVVAAAEPHQPPTIINFPDQQLRIPLVSSAWKKTEFNYDDPDFQFATALNFDLDEPILEYMRNLGNKDILRGPPDPDKEEQVAIGYIYLTIHNDMSAWFAENVPKDIVLFDFCTTGTRMSLLFDASTSIRETFWGLLESIPGLYGILDREFEGELFWYQGQRLSRSTGNIYMRPEEVESIMTEPWEGNYYEY